MPVKLNYIIKFVDDMNRAIAFYRDVLGLPLKFESPGWSEFTTGETTLALHLASPENPANSMQLGFQVPDVDDFHADMQARGIKFTMPPTEQFGARLARFVDSEGAECLVGP
jgi:predicted enzyme related to lactoylglutathione lyase